MDKVVIVMPTFNEAKNIGTMIEALFNEEFPKIDNAEMHLLVVDANSPDGTGDVVKGYMDDFENLHLLSKEKGGLGADYIAGFKHAMDNLEADAVMEMDADGQHPPDNVKRMVDAYMNGADYAIGSRYIPGGSVPKEWAFSRRAVSYLGNLFIRVVWLNFKLHDMTTGFRLTRVKGVLDKINLDEIREQDKFAYKVDLLFKSIKNSEEVVEVPLEFKPRTQEKSKFNTNEMIATFKLATLLGILDKKKFIKFGTVGFLGFIVNFVFLRIFRGMGFTETLTWLFATEMAIINNYVLNNIWTFKESKISGIRKTIYKFLQFNLTSAGALAIQAIFGPLGVRLIGVEYDWLVLAIVIVFMVLPYNYFMYNVVIWKSWDLSRIFRRN